MHVLVVRKQEPTPGLIRRLFDLCPTVDPRLLLSIMDVVDSLLQTYDPQFEQCTGILQQTSCQNDLGYPDLGYGLTYLTAVPSTAGTGSYSNLPGTLATPTGSLNSAAGSARATAKNGNKADSSSGASSSQGADSSGAENQQPSTTAMNSGGIAGAASSSSVSATTSRASSGMEKLMGVVSLLIYGIACYAFLEGTRVL
ncbi:hypothetical protein D0859_10592 [Hortaea werneckii]|uniref:Uncharacterized protein n=1 Tax=Hortaea werneckii TaxID=91943 RepID=A0A3M7IJ14_HORWE|nr:hypothetical protein D0859_10592 [Hortaea werneckii]